MQNGTDLARPFYIVSDYFATLFEKKSKLKVEYKRQEYAYTSAQKKQQSKTQASPNKEIVNKQEKLDAILDKINRSSYDSLTNEEKEFLFKISQED